jgi:hypothetical protein
MDSETPVTHLRVQPSAPGPQASHVNHRLTDKGASAGIPSEPLLGALPLRRLIPQDVHSLLDYGGALATLGAGWLSGDARLKAACTALAATDAGMSALTDYRLSLAKLVPIEVHEVMDHVWGLSVAATPFVLGTWRRAPVASAVLVANGLTTVVASLFTDYCSVRGVKWRRRSKTDLGPVGA